MRYLLSLIILCFFSCNNERVLQLSEIKNADVTEVLDVSPAYLFYDEAQADSTLLNRKNLIGTTNWLVNIDKRLTLRQAIPHIKFLQEKKRNAELHKNKNAKNYFTCNDTSISNLGFLEFTDVYYDFSEPENDAINLLKISSEDLKKERADSNDFSTLFLKINEDNKVTFKNEIINFIELLELNSSISEDLKITPFTINLYFEKNLRFQDYISIKSELSKFYSDHVKIDANEFIY